MLIDINHYYHTSKKERNVVNVHQLHFERTDADGTYRHPLIKGRLTMPHLNNSTEKCNGLPGKIE